MSVLAGNTAFSNGTAVVEKQGVLSEQDVQRLLEKGDELVAQGLAGRCLQLSTDAGEQVVAIIDKDCDSLICAFGRIGDTYCAIDANSRVLGQGETLDEVLSILPYVFGPHPELSTIPS